MPFEVVLIVLAGIGGTLMIVRWGIQHEERKMNYRAGKHSGGEDVRRLEATVGGMAQEMNRLRDRVQVLEKLVTDDDRKLADEIERLRASSPRA